MFVVAPLNLIRSVVRGYSCVRPVYADTIGIWYGGLPRTLPLGGRKETNSAAAGPRRRGGPDRSQQVTPKDLLGIDGPADAESHRIPRRVSRRESRRLHRRIGRGNDVPRVESVAQIAT